MPEKGLSEIQRSTRELYDKGIAALQRQNYDYAIAILCQVLTNEPGFYDAREALRASQFKKAGNRGGLIKKFFGSASLQSTLAKAQLLRRNDPLECIKTVENVLTQDPDNVSAHRLLAEAAIAADLPRTAILSLEIAFKHAPKDREIAIALAEALARSGQVVKAESIYSELTKAHPGDASLQQGLKNMSAQRTMREGGYDAVATGEASYRDLLKDKHEAETLELEHREVKTESMTDRLLQEYEARYALEPHNLKLLRTLAELYVQSKKFDRALEAYDLIITTEGVSEPTLERAIADTTVKKLDHEIALLDPAATDYAQNLERLQAERQNYRLSECQRRAERYPNDLQIRFELGQLYLEAGKITEAIQEFQKAQANPHRRTQALHHLGICFARRGVFDLAARTLQNALKEKLTFDEEKKGILYDLGVVLESMGKKEEAVEYFKQIYEIDIGYKDVAAKVDAYYAAQ